VKLKEGWAPTGKSFLDRLGAACILGLDIGSCQPEWSCAGKGTRVFASRAVQKGVR